MATGSASTLLMLRTIAVWDRAPLVTAPLVIASLGQWGMLLRSSLTVRSRWGDPSGPCLVSADFPRVIEGSYLYSELSTRNFFLTLLLWGQNKALKLMLNIAMSFDLVVLVLTTIGLVRSPSRSSLWQLLFRQGVIYFLVAFVANTVSVVFVLLNLNGMCFLRSSQLHEDCDYERRANSLLIYSSHGRDVLFSRSGSLMHCCLPLICVSHEFPAKGRLRPCCCAPPSSSSPSQWRF
jgi:hypothetical protein